MADVSAAVVGRIAAIMEAKMFLHSPGGTSALILTNGTKYYGIHMANAYGVRIVLLQTVATSGCTLVEVVACSDLSGTNATVVKSAVVALTDLQHQFSIEVLADEVKAAAIAAGMDLPYLTVRLTCGSSADRIAVCFIEYPLRFGGRLNTFYPGTPIYATDYGV